MHFSSIALSERKISECRSEEIKEEGKYERVNKIKNLSYYLIRNWEKKLVLIDNKVRRPEKGATKNNKRLHEKNYPFGFMYSFHPLYNERLKIYFILFIHNIASKNKLFNMKNSNNFKTMKNMLLCNRDDDDDEEDIVLGESDTD
ncbi:hypothetical protein NPIL_157561 [Nephila pilipes]|uniref:Uncharacterized protein n=1 Tax=Nephila pilipes TaxID=299642 RepID=A0A8X6I7E3_NEPPI|nr:hypothetical protein NPIL_157561 [Nephila pilipes]